MRAAIAQISTTDDVAANLDLVRSHTERAAAAGADLVVFPEAAMIGFGHDLLSAAREHAEHWKTELMWLAAEQEITVLVGEFEEAEPVDGRDRVRNVLAAYTPEGERFDYAKIHLYDAFGFRESQTVAPGDEPVVISVAGHRVGLALCYDLRFPKLFAELSRAGAELIVCAASWGAGEGKAEQWEVLTRARALDSNTVVAAVGQADPAVTGAPVPDDAPTGIGRSVVADPFGHALAQLDGGEHLEIVDLDLDVVARAREALPVLENARLGY